MKTSARLVFAAFCLAASLAVMVLCAALWLKFGWLSDKGTILAVGGMFLISLLAYFVLAGLLVRLLRPRADMAANIAAILVIVGGCSVILALSGGERVRPAGGVDPRWVTVIVVMIAVLFGRGLLIQRNRHRREDAATSYSNATSVFNPDQSPRP